jgi:hypothetical protein
MYTMAKKTRLLFQWKNISAKSHRIGKFFNRQVAYCCVGFLCCLGCVHHNGFSWFQEKTVLLNLKFLGDAVNNVHVNYGLFFEQSQRISDSTFSDGDVFLQSMLKRDSQSNGTRLWFHKDGYEARDVLLTSANRREIKVEFSRTTDYKLLLNRLFTSDLNTHSTIFVLIWPEEGDSLFQIRKRIDVECGENLSLVPMQYYLLLTIHIDNQLELFLSLHRIRLDKAKNFYIDILQRFPKISIVNFDFSSFMYYKINTKKRIHFPSGTFFSETEYNMMLSLSELYATDDCIVLFFHDISERSQLLFLRKDGSIGILSTP